jgi:hypothetical protein
MPWLNLNWWLHLGVVEFKEIHTSDKIAEKLTKLFKKMDVALLNKVVYTTHDAASNNACKKIVAGIHSMVGHNLQARP